MHKVGNDESEGSMRLREWIFGVIDRAVYNIKERMQAGKRFAVLAAYK